MKTLTGATRLAFLGFFSSHIVFTILVDSQVVLPPSLVPQVLRDLLAFEVETFNDPIMRNARDKDTMLWFQSMVWLELLCQLPFFCWAVYNLLLFNDKHNNASSSTSSNNNNQIIAYYYPDSFRTACIAYGAHTATTMIPILATLLLGDNNNATITIGERIMVTGLYLPYLLFPLWILGIAATSTTSTTATITASKIKKG